MDKLVRYIDCYIPTETCNFKCHYCYIAKQKKFSNKLVKFEHDSKFMRKALSTERLGGKCLINLCAGGETLLSEDVLELMHELLKEGHYLTIVTNGSVSKRFDEISSWDIELRRHILFKFSFHYLELLRLNLLDTFIKNVKLMHESGCSITVEVTPNDELIPYIDEIKNICIKEFGALCHVTIARDDLDKNISHLSKFDFDKYINIWSTFNSDLFEFKKTIFYKKRKEFCYAGCWTLYLNISSGDLQQCVYGNYLGNIYKDIDSPIHFCPVGNNCEYPHCYNGHSYLTLGAIPEIKSPSYLMMRDRIMNNGQHWVKSEFADFINQKLYDNNMQYNKRKQTLLNRENKVIKIKTIINKIRRKL